MAVPIVIPRIIRGQLFFEIGNVAFPSLKSALCALSAAQCHRLDLIGGAL
jgi:hypothetical protein